MTQITRTIDVSRIQDVSDGIPYPIRRLDATQVVNYKDFDGKDRCKETTLSKFRIAAITLLDFP